jgi:hypothetical protein
MPAIDWMRLKHQYNKLTCISKCKERKKRRCIVKLCVGEIDLNNLRQVKIMDCNESHLLSIPIDKK